jgi:hypothetical protein
MDDDTYVSFRVLDILNRASKEKGEYTRVSLREVSNELNIDFDFFMRRYGNELHKLDYVVPDVGSNAYITPKGIAILEQNNPLYQSYRPQEDKSITIHGSVTGSAIIQGNSNSVNITFDFLSKLQEQIDKSALPEEEKKTWSSRIKEMASHPLLASVVSAALGAVVKAYGQGG